MRTIAALAGGFTLAVLVAGCGSAPGPRLAQFPQASVLGFPVMPAMPPRVARSARPGGASGLPARPLDEGRRGEACAVANRGRSTDAQVATAPPRAGDPAQRQGAAGSSSPSPAPPRLDELMAARGAVPRMDEIMARQGTALASSSRLMRAQLLQQQGLIDAAYELMADQLCDPADPDPVHVLEALAENRERAGDLERAIWFEERVVEARRAGGPDERAVAADGLAKIARLYAELGDPEAARARTGAAESLLVSFRPEDAPNLGMGYFGLAFAYARMGDDAAVRRSVQHWQDAMQRELSDMGPSGDALMAGMLGRVLVEIKDYPAAKRLASEALARPVRLPPDMEAALAAMPAMQGMFAGMTATLQQFSELTLADVAIAEGNGPEALARLARYQDARTRSRQLGDSASQLAGRTALAAPGVGQALASSRALLNAKRYAELAELSWKYAQAYRLTGQSREAAAQLVRAVDTIEHLRGFVAPDDRLAFFGRETGPYHMLVDLLIDLPPGAAPPELKSADRGATSAEAAFYYAEAARARLLSELLARQLAQRGAASDLPPDLAREERDLLARARAELGSGVPFDESPAYRQFQAFVERLRASEPRYANLKYPTTVTARQVPVREGEVVIAYSVLGQRIAAWLLRKDAAPELFVTPVARGEVLDTVARLRRSLEPDSAGNLPDFDQAAGATLFRWLLADPLTSVPAGTRVVIVPDSALATFPFDVLGPSPGAFLGDDYSVSYAPSATVLWFQRTFADRAPAGGGALILADPAYDERALAARPADAAASPSRGAALRAYAAKQRIGALGSLPGTRQEAALVAKALEPGRAVVDVRLGAQANEHDVKTLDLTRYGRLHFATHGVLADDVPYLREPALVLSQVGDLQGEDGFLTMSEIAGLKLRAELTVLSACQTGLGREVTGEGTMSLARVFMHAGSRSVVVSLWRVEDRATAALMGRMYRGLAEGKPPKAALDQARRELRQNPAWSHPFFWAPFIVYAPD